ncbi:MAG: type II toxin-antitoxin system HigB family toxin [Bacteroidota bacterium]
MRIIAKSTLREFWENPNYRDSEQALRTWYEDALEAEWQNPNDIKAQYGNASIVGKNRVVFNIAGNKYRLIVLALYRKQILYVRFIGTHKEYDKINAETI